MDTLRDSVTILLIEDDSATIDVLRPALEDEGYRVHHVAATPSAETMADLHPDLLVVDLTPGGPTTNWQVVREVEVLSGHRDLPVIVFRGEGAFVAEGDVHAHSRATAVLARPVQLEVLLPVVSHALERRRDGHSYLPHFFDEPVPESSWGW